MTNAKGTGGGPRRATTGPSGETRRPLSDEITPRERAFISAAAEIEQTDALTAGAVGFVSPLLAQFALPLRDPGQVSRWTRRNGTKRLILRPATLTDKEGRDVDGFPFGLYPRLVLAHLATEAVTRQSPVVSVGESLNSFMASLGLHKDGRSRRRFTDQVARLTGASLTIKHTHDQVQRADSYVIAESVNLWLGDEERPIDENVPEVTASARLIWPETVHLSTDFYVDLISRPVPVDLRALRALAPWPSAMDGYVWLTWRLYRLRTPSRPIPWAQLAEQFGGQRSRERRFRTEFMRALDEKVHPLYPAAQYEATPNGLVLYPSPTHVPTTKLRRSDRPAPAEKQGAAVAPRKRSGWCAAHDQWAPCTGCAGDRKAGENQ